MGKGTILKRLREELEVNAGFQAKSYESQRVSGQTHDNLRELWGKTGEITGIDA